MLDKQEVFTCDSATNLKGPNETCGEREKEENSFRTGRSWGWEIEGETDRFCQRVFDIADIDRVELLWGRGGGEQR